MKRILLPSWLCPSEQSAYSPPPLPPSLPRKASCKHIQVSCTIVCKCRINVKKRRINVEKRPIEAYIHNFVYICTLIICIVRIYIIYIMFL